MISFGHTCSIVVLHMNSSNRRVFGPCPEKDFLFQSLGCFIGIYKPCKSFWLKFWSTKENWNKLFVLLRHWLGVLLRTSSWDLLNKHTWRYGLKPIVLPNFCSISRNAFVIKAAGNIERVEPSSAKKRYSFNMSNMSSENKTDHYTRESEKVFLCLTVASEWMLS